ncbi:recombinase family protein [Kocuria rhizophila]|nr:recombinase family protein [Kocuria rhizophila]
MDAVIYARISQHRGHPARREPPARGLSAGLQRPGWTVVHEYVENDTSATRASFAPIPADAPQWPERTAGAPSCGTWTDSPGPPGNSKMLIDLADAHSTAPGRHWWGD